MLLSLATKIFGSSNDRLVKKLSQHIAPINELEPRFEAMSDTELQAQTNVFRQRLENGEPLDNLMHESFAVVREAAKRTLGQRHYDVQLMGGVVLHEGNIAEMKTGEGKTLVSTLPIYLNALSGKGAHIVTVNDYLAKRDSEWMGEIHRFLGLSVACITNELHPEERKDAYACDITYATNNELGFDYLRDNMRLQPGKIVQRDLNFAIVDEVDSILIDEARTPLIISGPSETASELYVEINKIIPDLDIHDYELDEKHKTVVLTEEGTEHIEQLLKDKGLLNDGGLYDAQNISLVHHANQALRANKLFHLDKDYIIKENRVVLIDEFTGRMMDGRRLSEGLHQAIEAKEGVEIQTENQTLASVTFQNYFRLYPKLSGMTGTAQTEAAEFQEIYNLGVVTMPTNVEIKRIDSNDKIYKSLAEKNIAIMELAKECQARKQPVLIGTVSIEKSENLSQLLKKNKIKHNVLNARHHEQEAQIIAQAGHPGAVTIATNMAGRGTDIQLGGNLEMRIENEIDESWPEDKKQEAAEKIKEEIARDKALVKEAGGLYVIGTERHESRRIDNQLRGRSGRQGDPGASIFFLSVEDDLMRIFAGDKLESLLANQRIGLQEGESLEHPLISKMLQRAQAKVEGMHFEIRKNLLKFDDVMNDQRTVIYNQRREIMHSEDLSDVAKDMRYDVIEDMVNAAIPPGSYPEKWDIETLHLNAMRLLGQDLPIAEWAKEEGIADAEILERITDITDRALAEKAAEAGPENFRKLERAIILQMLDQHWKEHLLNLDHLRQGINLRAFGQRDPLNEYKTEAFAAFENMLTQIRETITMTLCVVEVRRGDNRVGLAMPGFVRADEREIHETRQDPALMGAGPQDDQQGQNQTLQAPSLQQGLQGSQGGSNITSITRKPQKPFDKKDPSSWGKVQRNASCPCGSGKKFKHCHGSLQKKA